MKTSSPTEYTNAHDSGHQPDRAAFVCDADYRAAYGSVSNLGRNITAPSEIGAKSAQARSPATKTDEPNPYDISKENREQIYHIATTLTFRRATTIFSQGADASFVYFIDQGIVRLSRFAENGHRQVLGFHVAGDLIGLADNGFYANLAETVCTVRVHRVPWNQMLSLMLAEPKLQLAVFKKVVHDSLQAQSLIMLLGQQNTHQRLASCLVNLLRVPQFFDKQSARLRLPVNRFDLADYLGVASRSAERAFAKLEKQGLVRRITPRVIEILDIDGLERLQLEQRRSHH